MRRYDADLPLFLWLDENLVTLNTKLTGILCKNSVRIIHKHTLSWL
jgi:hypothetical protein